jgi:hypothetical protein
MFEKIKSKITGKPFAVSKVKGITIHSEESIHPQTVRFENRGGVGTYHGYHLTVRCTGKNDEYPPQKEPYRTACTVSSLTPSDFEIHPGSRYLGFQVIELFYKTGSTLGTIIPSHHYIAIRVHYLTSYKQAVYKDINTGLIRKSDLESRQWKNRNFRKELV